MNDLPESVAIVANSDTNIYLFRAPIVRKLLEMGVTVYAIAPPGRFVADIENMGAVFIPWQLDRRSLNPLSAVWHTLALVRIYWRLKPNLVHHFTIKPNLYGLVAARLTGVPVILGGVTGLGHMFSLTGPWARIVRSVAQLLFRLTAKLSNGLTFQTQNDLEAFVRDGHVEQKRQGCQRRVWNRPGNLQS